MGRPKRGVVCKQYVPLAQLVEHPVEDRGVLSSNLRGYTEGMVEWQATKGLDNTPE